jgi:rubrerythrin
MDVLKIYKYALSREYEGKRFFEERAARVGHAAAVQAFRELAKEEQKHIDFLNRLIEGLPAGNSDGIEDDETKRFSSRAATEFLDQSVLEAMVPDLPVLRVAYLIERDFVEFYSSAAESAEGDAKKALTMLANWERGHERLFKDLHDKAMKAYDRMPWGG